MATTATLAGLPPSAHGARGPLTPAACEGAETAVVALGDARRRAALRCLVNVARRRHGLRALRASAGLDRVAAAHTGDMVARRYFSHVTPEGETLADRLRDGGVDYLRAGEALAWACGAATPRNAVRDWLASPAHRHILLDPEAARIGAGVATVTPSTACGDGATWTLLVARFPGRRA